MVVIYYPKTRVQLVVRLSSSTKYGCYFSTKVCLPDDYRRDEKLIGLLGSPDGDYYNDWMNTEGTGLRVPGYGLSEKSYHYCTTYWCVKEKSSSLFWYEPGEDFKMFNKCGDNYDGRIESCVKTPPEWLKKICYLTDKRCLFEGCAGGPEEAKNALDAEYDLTNEKGCGETVLAEDFNENDVRKWKLIETEPVSGQTFLGRFHKFSKKVYQQFSIPDFTDFVTMEFLLYEIDDWGARNREANKFYVSFGLKHQSLKYEFSLGTFEDQDDMFHPGNSKVGYKSGIRWKRQAITCATNLGYNAEHKDQIHKVTINIPKYHFPRGKLGVTFYVAMEEDKSQLSAGVDELRIIAQPRKCGETKRKDCRSDGQQIAAKKFSESQKEEEEEAEDHNTRRRNKKKKGRRSLGDAADDYLGDIDENSAVNAGVDDASAPVECRVAFGYHSPKSSGSFQDILGMTSGLTYRNEDISWGWSNGPLEASNYAYSMDLYTTGKGSAGEPGLLVGKMTVEFDGEEATVSMEAGDHMWLKETNAYVGHGVAPELEDGVQTVDPEQYPISYDRMAMSRSFTVGDLEDKPIYIIAQATVCGVFEADPTRPSGVRGSNDETKESSWFTGLF
ncbi:expressed unknown protein [Seminavis robusta]|uniref:Uncharacterized protein n=1 Tax=Seminavis robusta TaxID=568900 RepID=A0A9N8F0P0_9STRA|nr:expressed unknown protein [Seminavis robusta]|eukprot:Sro2988_g341750.3  (614) ;mRNA; r:7854-9695